MERNAEILKELRKITSLADQLSSKNPYKLPEGYFQNLPANIMAKIGDNAAMEAGKEKLNPPAGTILFRRRLVHFAIAAAITGIIALGGWWYSQTLPIAPNPGIVQENTLQDTSFLQRVHDMSEIEIAGFVESSAIPVIYGNTTVSAEINDEDIKLMFADVSDAELQGYLEEGENALMRLN